MASHQRLNDREEQVSVAALMYFLKHLMFWQKGKHYSPLNEHDILAPGHSKAHVISAIQKLSGQPITQSFQNPPVEQTRTRENRRAQAEIEVTKILQSQGWTPEKIEATFFDLYVLEAW